MIISKFNLFQVPCFFFFLMDCIFVTSFIVALKKQHLLLDLFVFAKFLRTSEVDNKTH